MSTMSTIHLRLYSNGARAQIDKGEGEGEVSICGWDHAPGTELIINGDCYLLTKVWDSYCAGDVRGNYLLAEAEPCIERGMGDDE